MLHKEKEPPTPRVEARSSQPCGMTMREKEERNKYLKSCTRNKNIYKRSLLKIYKRGS